MNPSKAFALTMRLALIAGVLCLAKGQALAQLRVSPTLKLGTLEQSREQRSADFVVAIVNSEPITQNEVRKRVLQIEQQASARGGALPPREEIYPQVLERLINERIQIQLARDSGMKVDKAALDAAVLNVARQNQLSVEQMRRRMREEGIDYDSFRNELRDEMLLKRIREREIEPRAQVTDAELDQFVKEQRGPGGDSVTEISLAHILVAIPDGASEAQLAPLAAKAQRAYERARAGEDFAALARELSDAPDRASGGLLGMRPLDRYPASFVEATRNLASGAVAQPIRSGAGFHVLKVVDLKREGSSSLKVQQTKARHILLRTGTQIDEAAALERIKALRQRIVSGLDFAQAAREYSQDGSAAQGGDLGWSTAGQFVPEFEQVMNALAVGQVSEPVVTRFGVHLIQVQDRRERDMDEREQREAARAALRDKKLDEAFATWAQDLRARAYVELRQPTP